MTSHSLASVLQSGVAALLALLNVGCLVPPPLNTLLWQTDGISESCKEVLEVRVSKEGGICATYRPLVHRESSCTVASHEALFLLLPDDAKALVRADPDCHVGIVCVHAMIPAPPYIRVEPQPTVFTRVRPRPYISLIPERDPSVCEPRLTREEADELVAGWEKIPIFPFAGLSSASASVSEMPGLTVAHDSRVAIVSGNRVELPYAQGRQRVRLQIPSVDGWEYASYPYVRGLLTPVAIAGDLVLLPVAGCLQGLLGVLMLPVAYLIY